MIANPLTVDELGALPPLVDVPTVARALAIGRSQAYALALSGDLPVPVLRLGARTLRVRSADIRALLGISSSPTPTGELHDVTGDAPRTRLEAPSPTPDASNLCTASANKIGASPHDTHSVHVPATPDRAR